jgi:hypothetical protein
MYLLIVLAAGLVTAWWGAQAVGADLSGLRTAASVLGLTETIGATHPVGYSQALADQRASAVAAPHCNPGQTPAFSDGLTQLKVKLGDAMGNPVECEHPASGIGDTVQQTSTGLAAYYKLTNTVTFTDGWRHWAITPAGFTNWEGSESQPPVGSG